MGDNILMKMIFIVFLGFSSLFSNELQWVDHQINSILPDRVGITSSELSDLKDPFANVKTTKEQKVKKTIVTKRRYRSRQSSFTLGAIMNNSALINGSWYRLGSRIKGYKVSSISDARVILKRGKRTLYLTTKTKKSTLKIIK